jgi:hypothetical protein
MREVSIENQEVTEVSGDTASGGEGFSVYRRSVY